MWERHMWKWVDWWLFGTMVVLQIFGLLALASATYTTGWSKVMRQAVWMALGWGAFLLAMRGDFQRWARWANWIYWGNLFPLVLVLLVGYEQYGTQRWLKIGGITV